MNSHQELERQLQESIERYELVAKATNDVIYDIDITTGTVTWNDAFYSRYGYSRDEPADTVDWWARHIHPDDAFRVEEDLTRLIVGSESTWHSEYRFQKADGSYAYVQDRAFVSRSPDGGIQRIIGSVLDVTQQKQLDRAKDEFLSLVSHQLRTPLTVIRMFSEMLGSGLAGDMNPRQKDYCDKIAEASVRMIHLVGDILNISRLELARVKIVPVPTDLTVLITQHLEGVKPLADAKDLRLVFNPDPMVTRVAVDPTVFGQIIHNLLTNAIRYTPKGGDQIEVALHQDERGSVLSVKDSGIGIPLKAQAQVFGRFYRADNAVNFEGEGTGLGLYLVKLIVDTFQGRIWFDSQEGKGTTFYVRLPKQGMQPMSGDYSPGHLQREEA